MKPDHPDLSNIGLRSWDCNNSPDPVKGKKYRNREKGDCGETGLRSSQHGKSTYLIRVRIKQTPKKYLKQRLTGIVELKNAPRRSGTRSH